MSDAAFTSFALLGSGRVARHFRYYLQALNLPLKLWSRNGDPDFNSGASLEQTVEHSSHILMAVRDDALAHLASRVQAPGKTLVHFSGASQIPGAHSAHPLMTFGPRLENLNWYQAIPFVVDQGFSLGELLPGLSNRSWPLNPEQRSLYHALSSLAGNSTYLLWRNIGDEFENKLGLPRALLAPFLKQVVINATSDRSDGLTGPVARQDWQTVWSHFQVLGDPGLREAYQNYLNLALSSGYPIPKEMLS